MEFTDLPYVDVEDERSRAIGNRSGRNAFVAVSALLLAAIVVHLLEHGLANLGAVSFELGGFLLGWLVYAGSGVYYTRTT